MGEFLNVYENTAKPLQQGFLLEGYFDALGHQPGGGVFTIPDGGMHIDIHYSPIKEGIKLVYSDEESPEQEFISVETSIKEVSGNFTTIKFNNAQRRAEFTQGYLTKLEEKLGIYPKNILIQTQKAGQETEDIDTVMTSKGYEKIACVNTNEGSQALHYKMQANW